MADVISGFIFLGSPHFSGDVDDVEKARRTFDLLLKCQNKGIGRSLSSKAHIEDLVRVCKAFELLNFGTPVVSVYETKETVTAHSFFSKIGSKSRGQMVCLSMLIFFWLSISKKERKQTHKDIDCAKGGCYTRCCW